ncbi:S-adenosyl-L-methionine-dependent methyltransferase [Phanerochaete sordida]|uniref:S-adenosyl-L-methionine-dependent methyltransferase n=1 Tax=Phanerochaete sordida TaxID=48140 RepID=A0A9P3G979_9APHY|nr:S-adenosyl-L-methionine-dependent methyltransferase [Phanerochaete sordida]
MSQKGATGSYTLQSVDGAPDEVSRLDELHVGIAQFLGGRLSFADLSSPSAPGAILELGCGSGAWAIQAAQTFPEADVVAVDINRLPERPLPPNVRFHQGDITHGLPFSPASFDVVHARLVMMHIPDGEAVLRRMISLVKPGGWLLVEDPDDDHMLDDGGPLSPALAEFEQAWIGIMRARGANPCIGRDLEGIVRSSGAFRAVNVKRVVVPISGHSSDPALRQLGISWKETGSRLMQYLPTRYYADGITEQLTSRCHDELMDTSRNITTDMYFVWAQKEL